MLFLCICCMEHVIPVHLLCGACYSCAHSLVCFLMLPINIHVGLNILPFNLQFLRRRRGCIVVCYRNVFGATRHRHLVIPGMPPHPSLLRQSPYLLYHLKLGAISIIFSLLYSAKIIPQSCDFPLNLRNQSPNSL